MILPEGSNLEKKSSLGSAFSNFCKDLIVTLNKSLKSSIVRVSSIGNWRISFKKRYSLSCSTFKFISNVSPMFLPSNTSLISWLVISAIGKENVIEYPSVFKSPFSSSAASKVTIVVSSIGPSKSLDTESFVKAKSSSVAFSSSVNIKE